VGSRNGPVNHPIVEETVGKEKLAACEKLLIVLDLVVARTCDTGADARPLVHSLASIAISNMPHTTCLCMPFFLWSFGSRHAGVAQSIIGF
jgi:hypothetical protein